jgi:hypothetical protein
LTYNSLLNLFIISVNVSNVFITSFNIYYRNIVYNPTAEYRKFELSGENDLYNLDIKFWYRTITGNLEPIYLDSGTYLSLKLGFFRKDLYRNLKK